MRQEVASGLYQTASEVVRAGLRRLKGDQDARLPKTPATMEELEAQLLQSLGRLDRGEGVPGKKALRWLHRKVKPSVPMLESLIDPAVEDEFLGHWRFIASI